MSVPAGLLRLLLVSAVTLISLGAFENLAVTTIMPVVAAELDGLALYALALGLPLATHIAATAVGGAWIDARSLRGPLTAGVWVFAGGLVIAGLAQSMLLVAFGRGITGLGTGLLTVALYASVGTLVPALARPRFFAAFSAAWVLPSLIGPPLAGYAAQFLTWRVVFLAVAPVAVVFLFTMRPLLRLADEVAAGRAAPGPRMRTRLTSLILPAVALATALAVLQGSGSAEGAARLPAAVALVLVLVLLPRLLPRGTFKLRRGVPAVVATRFLISGVVITMEAFLPLYLQREAGWEPGPAGLVLTIGSVTWAIGSWVQGRLQDPQLRHRASVAGAVLVAVGTGVASLVLIPGAPPQLALAGWVLSGSGMGVTFSAMAVLALGITPPERQGEISANLQIADGAGAALSLAAFGIAFTAALASGSNPYLPGFLAMVAFAVASVVSTARVPKLTGPRVTSVGGEQLA